MLLRKNPQFTALLPIWLCACTFPRTQTVVDIRADTQIASEATEIRVEVRTQLGGEIFTRTFYPQGSEFRGFPIEIPIAARNGDDTRTFDVRVIATTQRRQGTTVLTDTLADNRIRTGFRRGQVLRFTLWLLSGCRCNVETERCEPDADGDLVPECVPQTIDVNSQDAAVMAEDASVFDTTTSDTTVSEAGLPCQANQRLCDGFCFSLNSTIACGPSCSRCAAIPGGEPSCDNHACGITCAPPTPDRCPNACVRLETDATNCGSCGNACPTGQLCVNRNCQAPPQCTVAQDPACTGMSYCNLTMRMCAAGCDGRSGQCPGNTVCDTASHTCTCSTPNRMCGNVCAVCPSGTNATGFTCDGTACILSGCDRGYQRTNGNTQCLDINECNTDNGGCGSAMCSNSPGGFSCSFLNDGGMSDSRAPDPARDMLIYAHSANKLYVLENETLREIGTLHRSDNGTLRSFKDIALDQSATIYGVTDNELYRVSEIDATVTPLGTIDVGDDRFNSLTFVPAGTIDANEVLIALTERGLVFRVNTTTGQGLRTGTLPNALRPSGDLVATGAGIYATVVLPTEDCDSTAPGIQTCNHLARVEFNADGSMRSLIDLGEIQEDVAGEIYGHEQVWGLGYRGGTLYGFTGYGELLRINPNTARATLVADADATRVSRFFGAGVTTRSQ